MKASLAILGSAMPCLSWQHQPRGCTPSEQALQDWSSTKTCWTGACAENETGSMAELMLLPILVQACLQSCTTSTLAFTPQWADDGHCVFASLRFLQCKAALLSLHAVPAMVLLLLDELICRRWF